MELNFEPIGVNFLDLGQETTRKDYCRVFKKMNPEVVPHIFDLLDMMDRSLVIQDSILDEKDLILVLTKINPLT